MCCGRVKKQPFFTFASLASELHQEHQFAQSDEFAPLQLGRFEESPDDPEESELPCEPAGHGAIATGSVQSCKEFWRTFVRSPVVMDWIENGYRLLWTEVAPPVKELANAPSADEHRDFVSSAVAEMLAANAVTLLPPGEKPRVVSPLGWCRSAELISSGSRLTCDRLTGTWEERSSSSRD